MGMMPLDAWVMVGDTDPAVGVAVAIAVAVVAAGVPVFAVVGCFVVVVPASGRDVWGTRRFLWGRRLRWLMRRQPE